MKNKINYILIIALALLLVPKAEAQEGSKIKADKCYASLSYAEAAGLYELVVARDSNDKESLIKLANCYRLINDVQKAKNTYASIVKRGFASPLDKYYYAQTLIQTNENEKAIPYLQSYQLDNRGAEFLNAIKNSQNFFKDSACYRINKVSFNSKLNDFAPILPPGNKVVFTTSRNRAQWINYSHSWTGNAFYRLYYTIKNEKGNYSKPKKFLKSVNVKFNNGPVNISQDGKSMVLTQNNFSGRKPVYASDGKVKLKLVLLNIVDNKWVEDTKFPFNNSEYNVAHGAFSKDGNTLFFSSDMPGGEGGMDIWYCIRNDKGWSNPVNMGKSVNSPGNDIFPTVIANRFYYSSDGKEGMGGLDIFETSLNPVNMSVSKVINLGYPINTSGDDFGIVFSANLKSGYLSSNRETLDENDDIYEFSVVKEPQRGVQLISICKDRYTQIPLPNTLVSLLDEKGNKIAETTTNGKGEYAFIVDLGKTYTVSINKPDYYDYSQKVSVLPDYKEEKLEIVTELDKNPNTVLVLIVKDKETMNLILNEQYFKEKDITLTPNKKGEIRIPIIGNKLGETIQLAGVIKALNYFDKIVAQTVKVGTAGEIIVEELMSQPKVGLDIGKIIQINPIYFDLNKYNIRPDAAIELDKIVKVMKEYPGMTIELGSHTDCRSSAAYNLALSDKRAKASANYIISKGIAKGRIIGKGYGETKLINKCECEGKRVVPCTEEEHQANRRTEFIIIKMK